jgi:hypothetical protein
MDDPTGITGDVFEQIGSIGKGGGQSAADETKKIPKAIADQLFGSPRPPGSQDQKELAEKQELEEKKVKEKAQSEAEVQQILAQLEEEMAIHRRAREKEEEEYRRRELTTASPPTQIEEGQQKNLPAPLEVQKSRAEKSAALRGE